jgi:hypothetical protein
VEGRALREAQFQGDGDARRLELPGFRAHADAVQSPTGHVGDPLVVSAVSAFAERQVDRTP